LKAFLEDDEAEEGQFLPLEFFGLHGAEENGPRQRAMEDPFLKVDGKQLHGYWFIFSLCFTDNQVPQMIT